MPPRKLNPAVPARPGDRSCSRRWPRSRAGRYATAKELADELRRFLEHQPIRLATAEPARSGREMGLEAPLRRLVGGRLAGRPPGPVGRRAGGEQCPDLARAGLEGRGPPRAGGRARGRGGGRAAGAGESPAGPQGGRRAVHSACRGTVCGAPDAAAAAEIPPPGAGVLRGVLHPEGFRPRDPLRDGTRLPTSREHPAPPRPASRGLRGPQPGRHRARGARRAIPGRGEVPGRAGLGLQHPGLHAHRCRRGSPGERGISASNGAPGGIGVGIADRARLAA